MKNRFSPLFAALGLVIFAGPAFAFAIPEKPQSYVNDYASLLSPGARQELEGILGDFEKETSNQVVLAIFPSLDGEVLEDLSIRLAEKWKIGTKKNDNGILLLIFRDDHAVRLEVGYGLEGALPDALAGQIIRNELVPAFREGDYDRGVLKAVSAVLQATRGEYKAASPNDPMEEYAPWLFLILVFYLLIPLLGYGILLVFATSFFGLPGFGVGLVVALALEMLRRTFFPSLLSRTYSSRGGGGFGGGFGGSGFGGGFGGGGGGSFGGGGASGRW